MPTPRRYSVPCHSCDGEGFVRGTDGDGNATLDACRWCYRGLVAILLMPDDERQLLAELQKNVVGDARADTNRGNPAARS